MDLSDALHHLEARRKAKRLQGLWPAIEERLTQGVSHAEILGLLNDNGFALTERTYKSYLYRYRRRRRSAGHTHAPIDLIEGTRHQADGTARAAVLPAQGEGHGHLRPPTFDFDPRGISPDLLK